MEMDPRLKVNVRNCYGNQLMAGTKTKEFQCFTPRFPWKPLQHVP